MRTIRFRTEVELAKSNWELSYGKKTLFLGSCFSDNIGNKLQQYKFNVLVNPFGVVFNPQSISQLLERMIQQELFREEELVFHDGLWHLMDLHGSFSRNTTLETIQLANQNLIEAHEYLKTADFLFITFGTAWVFQYIPTGKIIGNCHKLPANQFKRYRLPLEQMIYDWEKVLEKVFGLNPSIKVVFTLSPVRHLKDGAHENQLSKSSLLLLIDHLVKGRFSSKNGYFPAYELVMDELRDYRFYNEDLVHLNDVAIRFIFEKLATSFFSPKTVSLLDEIEAIVMAKQHQLNGYNRGEEIKFAQRIINRINTINKSYPEINLNEEKDYFFDVLGKRD